MNVREKLHIATQVLREHLERSRKSPYGMDCANALASIEGALGNTCPNLAKVIGELRELGRETERKRGWH
jgi:hypothetical protein